MAVVAGLADLGPLLVEEVVRLHLLADPSATRGFVETLCFDEFEPAR